MTYEKIIVSQEKGTGCLSLVHIKDYSAGVKELEEYLNGTIVALHPESEEGVEVTIFTEEKRILLLHAKCVIYTKLDGLDTDQILSAYEVLWAAGAKMEEGSLKPVIDASGQTSLKGVYYIQTNSLGKQGLSTIGIRGKIRA